MDDGTAQTVEAIKAYIKDKEPLLMEQIARVVPRQSAIRNLYDAMNYHLGLGGKRLRPGLVLLVADRLGLDFRKLLPLAAAVELCHNFTLVADDIQDSDRLRRDQPAVWVKYGIPHAINISDGMFAKAYESLLLSDLPDTQVRELVGMLTEAVVTIVEGQAMDMNFRGRMDVTEQEYMDMIWRKTGILFGICLSGPAYAASAPKAVQEALARYGKALGPAFQIADDLLDIDPEKHKGRELGADIKEGKRSLMVIKAFGAIKEKDRLLAILDKPKEKTTKADIDWTIKALKSCGAVEYARKKANELARKAQAELGPIKNSQLKRELMALAEYMVSREN